MMGAAIGGAGEDDIKILEKVGSDVGMAFQIQDDILDVISDSETLGKPVGSDEKNNKCTYVTINGIDESKKRVEDLSNNALKNLKSLNRENEFLEKLIIYLSTREV